MIFIILIITQWFGNLSLIIQLIVIDDNDYLDSCVSFESSWWSLCFYCFSLVQVYNFWGSFRKSVKYSNEKCDLNNDMTILSGKKFAHYKIVGRFCFHFYECKKKNTSLIWLYVCDHNDCETNRICFTIHNFIENVQNRTKKKKMDHMIYTWNLLFVRSSFVVIIIIIIIEIDRQSWLFSFLFSLPLFCLFNYPLVKSCFLIYHPGKKNEKNSNREWKKTLNRRWYTHIHTHTHIKCYSWVIE